MIVLTAPPTFKVLWQISFPVTMHFTLTFELHLLCTDCSAVKPAAHLIVRLALCVYLGTFNKFDFSVT